MTQAAAADDNDDGDVSDEIMELPEYVVVWQVNPEAKQVLSYEPETRDADLKVALAKLPVAEDASVYEFGIDYEAACAFAAGDILTPPRSGFSRDPVLANIYLVPLALQAGLSGQRVLRFNRALNSHSMFPPPD